MKAQLTRRDSWVEAWHDGEMAISSASSASSAPMTGAPSASELLELMQARVPQMVKQLGEFVNLESPSLDVSHLQQSAKYLAELFAKVIGKPAETIPGANGPHVHWKGSDDTKVLIVGHHDTVFPLGTTATRPFRLTAISRAAPEYST